MRASNSLELALQIVVSCQAGAGNRTWALWENRQCFLTTEPSLQPVSLMFCAFSSGRLCASKNLSTSCRSSAPLHSGSHFLSETFSPSARLVVVPTFTPGFGALSHLFWFPSKPSFHSSFLSISFWFCCFPSSASFVFTTGSFRSRRFQPVLLSRAQRFPAFLTLQPCDPVPRVVVAPTIALSHGYNFHNCNLLLL